jgi:hypothetical protein
MKKLLLVLAIGAFVACNDSSTDAEATGDTSTLAPVDTTTVAPLDTTATTTPADTSAVTK